MDCMDLWRFMDFEGKGNPNIPSGILWQSDMALGNPQSKRKC